MDPSIDAKDNVIKQLQYELAVHIGNQRYERSRALVDGFSFTDLVYVMFLMDFADGSILIKIGKTTDLRERLGKISTMFGLKVFVMDVYPCEKIKQFEDLILQYLRSKGYSYTDIINNKCTNTEVFLLPHPDLYEGLKRKMQMDVSKYERRNIREIELLVEAKKIDAEIAKYALESQKYTLMSALLEKDTHGFHDILFNLSKQVLDDVTNSHHTNDISIQHEVEIIGEDLEGNIGDDEDEEVEFSEHFNGPIVRKFALDNLTEPLLEYEGLTLAVRKEAKEGNEASYSQLKTSAENCTVYLGHRWQIVVRNLRNEIIPLPETVSHQVRKTGLVACLTKDGKEIIDVFATQVLCAEYANISGGAVTLAIQNKSITRAKGNLPKMTIKMWSDVDEAIQMSWLQDHILPIIPPSDKCKPVLRTRVADGKEEPFESLEKLRKYTGVTKKTVDSSILTNTPKNGWTYMY
jgi:hypothetical protein